MARPAAKPKSAAPKVVTLTSRRCVKCGLPITSDTLYPVLVVGTGKKKMAFYHKSCY